MEPVSKQITVLKDCEMALKVHRSAQQETIARRAKITVRLLRSRLLKGHSHHLQFRENQNRGHTFAKAIPEITGIRG